MDEAMFRFNNSLFNRTHKSHYNDIDVPILDDARTIAPLGLFWRQIHIPKDIIELDVCKAFTKAFMDVSKIVVFNQFDVWKTCNDNFDIDNHHKLTMYYICVNDFCSTTPLTSTRRLFHKQYNLVTGQILKKLPEKVMKRLKILYYREPSFIHKVDSEGIVDELWNTTIDENNTDEDKHLKKKSHWQC